MSDATNLKSKVYGPTNNENQPFRKRSGSQNEESLTNIRSAKKQLSPIIEVTQREDYFAPKNPDSDKENINSLNDNEKSNEESVTEKLKEYIDEVDTALFEETGVRVTPTKNAEHKPEVVIIDLDKAEVSGKKGNKKSKFKVNTLGKKIKSLTAKKNKANKSKDKKTNTNGKTPIIYDTVEEVIEHKPETIEVVTPTPKVKKFVEAIESQDKNSTNMIHSSQKPADKLPLTRGRTVDKMVKRLSNDNCSPPPPKTNIMITPNVSVQHNNNQPFSYTRGVSPEKNYHNEDRSPTDSGSPIIYAQVVCGNGTKPHKQTVHTYMNGKKHVPHSDSDEGLGYEENTGFGRKYEGERTVTRFGDDKYTERKSSELFSDLDRFEEFPITPKFQTNGYTNGYNDYEKRYNNISKTEHTVYIDSSSRGRGDGMDAKRRESLSESLDNGFETPIKTSYNSTTLNGRSDLSARRDLLESRINRRLDEKYLRQSPEYSPNKTTNVYISESNSKYYRGGSKSPSGYKETYLAETKTDDSGEKYRNESHTKEYFGDRNQRNDFDKRYKLTDYSYNGFDEPKSFDSQISDYRSSPENRIFDSPDYKPPYNNKYKSKMEKQQTLKNREYYKSNPEIYRKTYDDREEPQETYHDSLRRERYENRYVSSSKYRTERYFDQTECDRKDKFGDSGIENDFRRDSGENFRVSRTPVNHHREFSNDSEDEGFASSLLIASERQHTEDNFNTRRHKHDYDSDRSYRKNDSERDDPYKHTERMDYKTGRRDSRNEFAHRERSIDDGSHYDPRIDKNMDRGTLKKVEKKPPKPEKKSSLDKVCVIYFFSYFYV